MALYKYANVLTQHKAGGFDVQMKPEHHVPASGIYRCAGCGGEIAMEEGFCFPTREHHAHRPSQGPIAWQLVVAAQKGAGWR